MTPKSQLSASHPHTTQKTMIPASVLLTQRLLPLQGLSILLPLECSDEDIKQFMDVCDGFSLPADQILIHFSLGKILI